MFRLALAGARASLNMTRDWGFREPMAAAEPIPRLTTPVRANRREPGDPGRRRSGWQVPRGDALSLSRTAGSEHEGP
jgi:hypothetical protein